MDLEAAFSKPVQLDGCEGILRGALQTRRAELRKSWKHFISPKCLESLGSAARDVELFLSGQDAFRDWRFAATFTWMNCEASFMDCLRAIALAGKVEYQPADRSPSHLLPVDLNKLSSSERVKALCARYRCPLNIGLPSESEVAEELLRQLMVQD